jgi:hypothetical protein
MLRKKKNLQDSWNEKIEALVRGNTGYGSSAQGRGWLIHCVGGDGASVVVVVAT